MARGDRVLGEALAGAAAGDPVAAMAAADLCQDAGHLLCPLRVGEAYLVCTVTLYYVGRVVEVGPTWVRLRQASWVHWTGRLSTLLRQRKFSDGHGTRHPRVEPVGEVILWVGTAGVSAYPWTGGELPEEPIL